jgi:hypothetical protein
MLGFGASHHLSVFLSLYSTSHFRNLELLTTFDGRNVKLIDSPLMDVCHSPSCFKSEACEHESMSVESEAKPNTTVVKKKLLLLSSAACSSFEFHTGISLSSFPQAS